MGKVQLVLVIHNHQPVGNFDAVIEEVCQRSYLPFLQTLAKFPHVRIGLHTSGCLLEWMEQHSPDYLTLVRELIAKGQVEILGGGMYEPILPVLPERDALWQLTEMNSYIERLFGARPTGMWTPERVWEPQLPKLIRSAGLKYTLLDDFHFQAALTPEAIEAGYYRTSHAGFETELLPISKRLRYTMPFEPVDATFSYLADLTARHEKTPLAVFGDDGEKFGNWPDTYEWVYEQKWLEQFFQRLTDVQDWVELLLPAEAVERRQPEGHVYLPAVSYAEMGEWTSSSPDGDPPGHWRNYLARYPESRQMLDRTVHVSHKLSKHQSGKASNELDAVARNVAKAQCNCAYWHGVFGGIYLNYLRHALADHAIQAEAALHELDGGDTLVSQYPGGTDSTDLLLENANLGAVASPDHGLCVYRLDDRGKLFHWTNVLTRRSEHYHSKLTDAAAGNSDSEHASIHDRVVVKESGLEQLLVADSHQRVSFNIRGHSQLPAGTTDANMTVAQLMEDVVFDDWDHPAHSTQTGPDSVSSEINCGSTHLIKTVRLDGSMLGLSFVLSGENETELPGLISVEFNLSLLTADADDRWLETGGPRQRLDKSVLLKGTSNVALVDGWQGKKLELSAEQSAGVCYYPVYTASSSEGGFEKTYQGSCLMLLFNKPEGGMQYDIELSIKEISHGG